MPKKREIKKKIVKKLKDDLNGKWTLMKSKTEKISWRIIKKKKEPWGGGDLRNMKDKYRDFSIS